MTLIVFFDETAFEKGLDSSVTATAAGFSREMESFSFFFKLNVLIIVFQRIEALNCEFQKRDLTVHESHIRINKMIETVEMCREKGFDGIWNNITDEAELINMESPAIPRL